MRLNSWVKVAIQSGLASIGCLILLLGPPYFSNASVAERWGDPILEIQTVRDVEDLRLTLGDAPSQDRESMRIKTKIDFGFIASYVALLVSLGVGMAGRGGWRRVVGVVASLCAIAAGVFDAFENLAILDILDRTIVGTTEEMLAAIRGPSIVKWSLAAFSVALLVSHYESFVRSAVSRAFRSSEGGTRRAGH